jgi:activator of HSP90 ATPase
MNDTYAMVATERRTAICQERQFRAEPERVYEALLDSKKFSAFSGPPAQIDATEGGAFSIFGGYISGRNIELLEGERIVQSWRPKSWDTGIYSNVRFELMRYGKDTKVVLYHTGFPEEHYDHLYEGWDKNYWAPLAKFLK